ncbi:MULTISPECIES: sialidase family protein [Flavobacteriaceae]|uniref:sialidase family protein n=1 Tax=Flavobacteriaceae TaxID=49546 RepID=UPI0039E7E22E
MKSLFIYLFIGVIFLSCSDDPVVKNKDNIKGTIEFNDIVVSDLKSTNVNEDHVSEGVMVTLSNGDILNFYRNDPQKKGNHIGNHGRIVKRRSSDGGETWQNEVIIFSDEYDDRNIRGGITDEGYIVLFFRRFNAENRDTIDINYIISYDNGVSWTERKVLEFDTSIAEEVWFARPNPADYQFYGYPCYAKIFNKKNDFLIMVTDSYNDGVNEDADHYQFKISFE